MCFLSFFTSLVNENLNPTEVCTGLTLCPWEMQWNFEMIWCELDTFDKQILFLIFELHWFHSLPLRNAVEFLNDVNWIHLINRHYFQHLNCIGFILCPWAVVLLGLGSAYTNSQMWKYKYTNLEIQGQILPQSTEQRWWAEISWVDILPPFNF